MKLWLPYPTAPNVELIAPLIPRVVMSWQVYQDINHLISQCGKQELSWIGKAQRGAGKCPTDFYISAIRLLPQNSSLVHTRLDPAAIAQVAHQWIIEDGGNDNPCRFWGHTHPGPSTEPSHQDDQQMLQLIQGKCTPPFFIRGIFGQGSQHYHGEFTVYDYDRGVRIRHVPWDVEDRSRQKKWARRVARCITVNKRE